MLLARTARQVDANSTLGRWQRNGRDLYYSHAYGFGVLDVDKFLYIARFWSLLVILSSLICPWSMI